MKKNEKKTHKKIQKSDDPAFLFYFKSWISATQYMAKTSKSDWIDIMCYQANTGIPTLEIIKKICGDTFELTWSEISHFFREKNGGFFDKKLSKVLSERRAFCDSRRRNALSKYKIERKHMLSACSAYFLSYGHNKNRNKNNSLSSSSFALDSNMKDKFISTFESFVTMRSGINRKITKKGMQLLLSRLAYATLDMSLQIKILEYSIQNSYPDIYPEKVLKKYKNVPEIRERLAIYLPEDKVSRIMDLCPKITLALVNKKIEIMQRTRPSDPESFLYKIITTNYSPNGSGTVPPSSDSKKPITEDEYKKLSRSLQKKLKPQKHRTSAKKVYTLLEKPESFNNPGEEFAFKHIEIGDQIDELTFSKVPESLRSCFDSVNVPAETITMYHWPI